MCFRDELQALINRNSQENGSNTPDFILAQFLAGSLSAFDAAVNERERWYGRQPANVPPENPEFGQPSLENPPI